MHFTGHGWLRLVKPLVFVGDYVQLRVATRGSTQLAKCLRLP